MQQQQTNLATIYLSQYLHLRWEAALILIITAYGFSRYILTFLFLFSLGDPPHILSLQAFISLLTQDSLTAPSPLNFNTMINTCRGQLFLYSYLPLRVSDSNASLHPHHSSKRHSIFIFLFLFSWVIPPHILLLQAFHSLLTQEVLTKQKNHEWLPDFSFIPLMIIN